MPAQHQRFAPTPLPSLDLLFEARPLLISASMRVGEGGLLPVWLGAKSACACFIYVHHESGRLDLMSSTWPLSACPDPEEFDCLSFVGLTRMWDTSVWNGFATGTCLLRVVGVHGPGVAFDDDVVGFTDRRRESQLGTSILFWASWPLAPAALGLSAGDAPATLGEDRDAPMK